MSLFRSIFFTIAVFSLYGEYVVRSFLPDGVSYLVTTGWIFCIQSIINQSSSLRRGKQKQNKQKAKTEETNKRQPQNTRRASKKNILVSRLQQAAQERCNSPIRSGIQPRQEDKGKDNECDTQRKILILIKS